MRTFTVFAFAKYWFIQTYFFLMLLSPAINFFQQYASHRLQTLMLVLLVTMACFYGFATNASIDQTGYNTFNFCLLYFLAGYLRKYPLPVLDRRRAMLGLYLAASLAVGFCAATLYGLDMPRFAYRMYMYNNPLVILSALSLFFLFRSFSLRSDWVNRIAASVLAVYLLHAAPHVAPRIWQAVGEVYARWGMGPVFWGLLWAMGIVIFAAGIAVDQLRKRIVGPLGGRIAALIPQKYRL